MAILTKAQLTTANSSSFPDNNSQQITPQILRDFNQSVIDTLVDSLDTGSFANTGVSNQFTQANSFTSISASSFVSASAFVGDGSKITNITSSISLPILDEGVLQGYATSMNFTGSAISASVVAGTAIVNVNIEGAGLVTTSSFNSFTASTNTFTQSAQTSINALNQSSASQQVSINALNVFTASQSTASIVNSISSLNQFTQSAQLEINALEAFTASISGTNAFTASALTSINALNTNSASVNTSISNLNTTTASLNTSVSNLNIATASLNSKTGSYATTGSNTFSGNQIISGTFAVTDGNDARFSVGVNANDIVMRAGATSNISMSFGGDLAMFGDNVALRNSVGDASITIYNGTGVSQKAYSTKVTATGPSGSMLIADVQNNKTYITIGGSDENVFVEAPLRVNGALTASLQQGYVLVGNASGISSLVATSSFIDTFVSGNLVTTSSFNAYTQSNDQRVSSLETNSASVNTSITNINSTTASLNTSVSALNTFTASQSTASLVTSITELNTFSASALVSISNINSTTASLNTSVTNLNSATASLFGSASLSLYTASAFGNTITFTKGDTSTFSVSVVASPIDTGSFATTASFNAYTSSNDAKVNSLIAATGSFVTTSSFNTYTSSQSTASLVTSITELNTFSASALVSISNLNTTTASLNTSVSNLNTFSSSALISLSNLNTATASLFTSTSLSLITASFDNGTRNLTFTKGDTQTFSVNIPDVSGSTSGFATLGENTFTGSQTISSSLNVSGSANFVGGDVNFTDQSRNINIDVDRTIIKGQKATLISSSLDIEGTLTASLQDGFTYVGNATGRTTTVATSSFATNVSNLATTGSNSFNGNQTITGSLILSSSAALELQVIGNSVFTGSVAGNVVSASITSNTASIDFSLGNYFEVTSSVTPLHLDVTNITPGRTSTLILSASASSSVRFSPNVAQPSGSAYSGSAGSIDILSLVAFNTSKVNLVSTKALV